MASVNVTEFSNAYFEDMKSFEAVQNVAAGSTSDTFSGSTRRVRLVADAAVWFMIDYDPSVTSTTGIYLPANASFELLVQPNQKIAVIAA